MLSVNIGSHFDSRASIYRTGVGWELWGLGQPTGVSVSLRVPASLSPPPGCDQARSEVRNIRGKSLVFVDCWLNLIHSPELRPYWVRLPRKNTATRCKHDSTRLRFISGSPAATGNLISNLSRGEIGQTVKWF